MRQFTLLLSFILTIGAVNAQQSFPQEWKAKFPVSIEKWRISDDRQFIFGYSDKECAVLSGKDGKVLWSANYKDITGEKKIHFQYWVPTSEVITLYTNERMTKVCKKYILDIHTGKLLWQTEEWGTSNEYVEALDLAQFTPGYITLRNGSERKTVNIRTGQEDGNQNGSGIRFVVKNDFSYRDENIKIELNFDRTYDVGFMSSHKKKPINILCRDAKTGNTLWEQRIEGYYIHSLCNAGLFDWTSQDIFGADHLWVRVAGDRVMVIFEGLAVLDLKTGGLLWQTELKISDIDFKLVALDQQMGVASLPVADAESRRLYAFDLRDGNDIKCYNLDNGKVLWRSKAFKKESVIPDIRIYEDKLVVKSGGKIQRQRYVPGTNGNPDVCTKTIQDAGNNAIIVYDAASGKEIWHSENMAKDWDDKFKNTISTLFIHQGQMYVASDANILKINPSTGKLLASKPIKQLKIGELKNLYLAANELFIKCSSGLAKLSLEDVSPYWTANTGNYISDFSVGQAFYVITGEDKNSGFMEEFMRVDLETGKITGKIKDVSFPYFTDDGEYFYCRQKNEVMKYRTKS